MELFHALRTFYYSVEFWVTCKFKDLQGLKNQNFKLFLMMYLGIS